MSPEEGLGPLHCQRRRRFSLMEDARGRAGGVPGGVGREGPPPGSWAGGWWRKPVSGRRRWRGGGGRLPPGTLAAPNSELRVHLTPADLPPRPFAKVGRDGPRERGGAAGPAQFQAVPRSETIVPIIQSEGSTQPGLPPGWGALR